MWVHEYQAKELLRQHAIPVVEGVAIFTVQEAVEAALKLGGAAWYLKVQTHAQKCKQEPCLVGSIDELKKNVALLLNRPVCEKKRDGHISKVRRLLVEKYIEACYSFIVKIDIDYDFQKVILSIYHQDLMKYVALDPLIDTRRDDLVALFDDADLSTELKGVVSAIVLKIYKFFQMTDALYFSINLSLVDDVIMVTDAQMCFDDNALFRQLEISVLRDLDEENPNALEAALYDLDYKEFDGNIGCLSNGGGLVAVLVDELKHLGGKPANFVNVEGAMTEEKMHAAFEIMSRNDDMRVILMSVIAEILSCEEIAINIINAYKSARVTRPVIIRLKGVDEAAGTALLECSGLAIMPIQELTQAAEKAMLLGGKC